ncbi:Fe-S cluster assembly protein SufD [Salsuginibacillus halophilus]|uniref:Fe-S cluster assembly protein SufD n=1 Tax=Salsuginibacillus halophilus TaxID=517424 RepID=A0A2P8HE35_9BACI|nr:Fe-S cluster assembly protein SufD [Salsuginibacillus halophilus]PSL44431.1 Fe-S cluster assembly protein SufD [Salsuginibacillus halophilus]
MSVETKPTFDQNELKAFAERRGEPDWLVNRRLEAAAQVDELALPKPDKTNIKKWDFTSFNFEAPKAERVTAISELNDDIRVLIDENVEEQNLIVQQDGQPSYVQVSDRLREQGVIFTDIETAVREHSDLVEKYFMGPAMGKDNHKLTALNTAVMNGGVFVYVPKNTEVEAPLQTLNWQKDENVGLVNHVIVVAEANSRVTFLENYVSFSKEASVSNLISEVYVGDGAHVSFGAVDNFEEGMTTYVNRRGHVAKDAKLEWALGQMNDGNTVSENMTYLMGDGSYADTKTVSIGRNQQTQNFTTDIVHYGKHSEGYILKHGVMKDRATSIFNGITKIEKAATKAHGEQTERVLMLSDKSRGDANPILLIDEDDVTAGHAASVGKIDPMQMYYMMSRGIPRHEAERLIIHGFLAPVVGELPVQSVKDRMGEVIERKVY